MNAEIIERLEGSFQRDQFYQGTLVAFAGSQNSAVLLRMLLTAVTLAGDWKNDPRRSRALQVAVNRIIEAFSAPAETTGPPRSEHQQAVTEPAGRVLKIDEDKISGEAIAHVILTSAGLPGFEKAGGKP